MTDVREPEAAKGAANWERPGEAAAVCSLSQALIQARQALAEAGVDSPRLDAELLLAHVLGWRRGQLYTHSERNLQPEDRARFADLIMRRARREPVAYLTGHREFYGLDFCVDRRVLIPRPETELLVELALSEGGRLSESTKHLTVADIGTGCGAIAIAIALSLPAAEIFAVDLSAPALRVASENLRRHDLEGRVHLLQGDLLTPLPEPVDLIVANLPYVALREVAALSPEIYRYEPRQAWDGGEGGMEVIDRLLAGVPEYMHDGGSILLEIGATQGHAVREVAALHLPGAAVEIVQDGAGLDRVVRIDHVHNHTRVKGGRELCPT
jgi:release factor glutamine methyltransferase